MSSETTSRSTSLGNSFIPPGICRLVLMLTQDIQLQIRYGLYPIYAVVVLLFVAGIQYIPTELQSTAVTVVIFSDPVFLGMYFIASLVLFEKGEGVLDAMTTSPLRSTEYLLSKVLSLTILTVIASGLIAVLGYGIQFHAGLFALGVVLTSVLFILLGFVAVSRFDTLNSYFVTSLFYMLPFGVPLIGFIGIEHPLINVIPTQATIVLIGTAFGAIEPSTGWELLYAIGYLLTWIIIAWLLATRAFTKHIVHDAPSSEGSSTVTVPATTGTFDASRFGPVGMLLTSDLRNWLRDSLLLFVLALPIFYALIGRLAVPFLSDWLAPEYDLVTYYPLITGFFVFIPPLTIGFVVGLLILEEKEEHILEALWTTPLTGRGYLIYRSISAVAFSFILMLVMVPLTGFSAVPIEVLIPAAGVGALWVIVCALFLPAFATNTIEGVAVSKFVGFSIIIPVFAIALVPEPLQYVSGVIPLYWPLKALTIGTTGGPVSTSLVLLLPGVVAHAVVIGALVRKMRT